MTFIGRVYNVFATSKISKNYQWRVTSLQRQYHVFMLTGLVSQHAGGMIEWSYWPIGISGCRWHDRMKLMTHWYLRMQVACQNEAINPIGISGCRRYGRMKVLTHWVAHWRATSGRIGGSPWWQTGLTVDMKICPPLGHQGSSSFVPQVGYSAPQGTRSEGLLPVSRNCFDFTPRYILQLFWTTEPSRQFDR
jgi:hypothetical protein